MKLLFLISALFFLSSCNNNNFETGVHGIIEYGEGDCSLSEDSRSFEKYTGDVYFVNKDSLDKYQTTDFFQLFGYSQVVSISNGKLRTEVKPGKYVIMVKDFYFNDASNNITVIQDIILEKNIQFYKCTGQ
ncbi:MAG: hypothetical protein JXR58_10320 [Bacteroidales bacterium]|nr:hypothetical protein [Bacteroidales bacterium]